MLQRAGYQQVASGGNNSQARGGVGWGGHCSKGRCPLSTGAWASARNFILGIMRGGDAHPEI